jgi:hypothetical protein
MSFREDPEFEFVVNYLSRWMEPFESLEDIEDSVFQVFYWMRAGMEGYVYCSDTLIDRDSLLVCLGHSRS